jgi:lambda repressor-like predicted transcriptional regulator
MSGVVSTANAPQPLSVATSRDGRAIRTAPSGCAAEVTRRLPGEPLHELINRERLAGASIRDLSERWAVNRRTVQRFRSRRWVRRDAADRIAAAMGRHPSEIWPEWFHEGRRT